MERQYEIHWRIYDNDASGGARTILGATHMTRSITEALALINGWRMDDSKRGPLSEYWLVPV